MKTLSRLLLSVVLFVGFLADSSFGKAFGPRAASPAAFSATNAAWYSLAGAPSDSTYLLGTGVTLIADRSGNSAVNGLVLNGSSTNYASTPDSSAVSQQGDFELVGYAVSPDWTPSGAALMSGHDNLGTGRSFNLYIDTTGKLGTSLSTNGTAATDVLSSVAAPFTDFSAYWMKVTRASASGNVTFYYAPAQGSEPSSWTQLGTVQSGPTGNLFDSSATFSIGAGSGGSGAPFTGIVYRTILRNGIGGTIVLDANFSLVAKLAASFTESSANAATVTINTSGDLGARICGARDLVQLTAAKMPAFSVVSGYNTATFDGSNDYMKAAAFSLSQPETVYFVGSQKTWTLFNSFLMAARWRPHSLIKTR